MKTLPESRNPYGRRPVEFSEIDARSLMLDTESTEHRRPDASMATDISPDSEPAGATESCSVSSCKVVANVTLMEERARLMTRRMLSVHADEEV